MNMGDELTSATLKTATDVVGIGVRASERTLDLIAKLLQYLGTLSAKTADKRVKSTDLTDIRTGEVNIDKLKQNAMQNGDMIAISQNGFTKDDMKHIARKAKEYGLPVAFTNKNGKDNIYAAVRQSDLPLFKALCTDMMKNKLDTVPQELSNFKVKEWEIPFITNELNRYDLSAQFGKTTNDEHFCLFNKSDEKAILIARAEFVRKCDELNRGLKFDKEVEGSFTIIEQFTGKEISFDNTMSRNELADLMEHEFGYDENKAQIACAKFGEEMLTDENKKRYFSDNPQNEFSKIDTNIALEDESILVKPYTCWRLTPSTDNVPRIVYQDSNGDFAVLNPEKMRRSEMQLILESQLHITDEKTMTALIDKAEKVNEFYVKQNKKNISYIRDVTASDFGVFDTNTELPFSSVNNIIERDSKDSFSVQSTFEGGASSILPQSLVLSFSNKRAARSELYLMYKQQGVPDHVAKEMAKEVIKRAENQSAEKVVQIDEVKNDKITVSYGEKFTEIDTSDRQKAIEQLESSYNVSSESAEAILDKAAEKIEESPVVASTSIADEMSEETKKSTELDKKIETELPKLKNGHELHVADSSQNLVPELEQIEAPKKRSHR